MAAKRSSVPQFGKWDDEDNVPYTVYFEKARKNRGGKIINPNDPQENPEMFANNTGYPGPDPTPAPSSRQRTQPDEPIGRGGHKPAAHHQRESREDSDQFKQQFADSPARNNRNAGRAAAAAAVNDQSSQQQYGGRGTGSGRPGRQSGGSDNSFERSPLHPTHQARLGARGSGSPGREGKRGSDQTPQGTPARTRMQPKSRDETPSRDVIPKFGDWNVNDPQSADNYTYIFGQNGKSANTPDNNPTRKHHVDDDDAKSQKCCFPWGRK